jgi:hypothetical protein
VTEKLVHHLEVFVAPLLQLQNNRKKGDKDKKRSIGNMMEGGSDASRHINTSDPSRYIPMR